MKAIIQLLLLLILPAAAFGVGSPEQMTFEQLRYEQDAWYITYFWHVIALGVSPLFGYYFTEWAKDSLSKKPNKLALRNISMISTGLFAFLSWFKATGDMEGAVLIGVLIGMSNMAVVWVWHVLAKRFGGKDICQHDSDMTLTPFGWRKRCDKDNKTEAGK